jgi:hypothetical protein
MEAEGKANCYLENKWFEKIERRYPSLPFYFIYKVIMFTYVATYDFVLSL